MAASRIADILQCMQGNPKGVRFKDLSKVCEYYFGEPRNKSSSHHIYQMPWKGDPRVNIQNKKGMAKLYQVRQVLKAVKRIEDYENEN